ncbi:DUF4032 domain-containing protein [Brevibacterium sp. BRM-1]|uniref:DUF4032 domain-containing protein n=1 Tax=Brevibacterium sp. BRM-1 TaxID=2999062 RepID=UPI00227E1D85|nr:DUF4032 domain-containing protein [Brevibacterium sp. BRM-1]WAL40017.1 DUF4032 domain-containing protein [Brevibacterium sp. BRM-1]
MDLHVDELEADIARLPWSVPLADWPAELLVGLPRGISRHPVRFVELAGRIVAVKETQEPIARREYEVLAALSSLDAPAVQPLGYITGRTDAQGAPLPGALLTPHLEFSLPYRALFSRQLAANTASRLVDALAVLLVRLHLAGFFWGDVSLSNTLFRRDAEAFAAYLVDAETGELHPSLSAGQREHDLELARVNLAGDFMDLQAGGLMDAEADPLEMVNLLLERYRALWDELTATEEFADEERWRIDQRIRRLNALGFDLGEFTVTTDLDGTTTRIEPKVVEPGHHARRLDRLAGIRAQEGQARRLLNDLDSYRAAVGLGDASEEEAARSWLEHAYEPLLGMVPPELEGRLEGPQIFHEFLDHRWFLSERTGHDMDAAAAMRSYIDTVLARRPRESTFFRAPDTQALAEVRAAETGAGSDAAGTAAAAPTDEERAAP